MTDIETLRKVTETVTEQHKAMYLFIERLLDPEDLGHAVTPEVRQKAYYLLNGYGLRKEALK